MLCLLDSRLCQNRKPAASFLCYPNHAHILFVASVMDTDDML